ncbi:MAG: phage integrase N-terminal SAM-like domain-containing protein [Flavobacteriaceae bacterium]|nr:phage integrase N-terminal SAM-like domain-containing protein [Flavobacteriaceae bacterium]
MSFKKQYSEPKIYDAGGDLSKRWYVYYSFRNPKTDKLERQTPIYEGINTIKTFRERKKAITILCESIKGILESGKYNPYTDENEFEQSKKLNIPDAFKFVRELKISAMEETSYKDFKSRITQFEKWLLANGFVNRYINTVTKKSVINYLNEVQKKSSPKNRNNTRSSIGTFFQTLEDNEIIEHNFVDKINVVPTKPQRNKTYSQKQDEEILEHLKQNDKVLLLYIQFICFTILREIEINRLKVKDVDVLERKIYVKTKTKQLKTKLIPQILIDALPDLSLYDPESYLFGRNGFGMFWDASESSRREHYTETFKNTIKIPFKLEKNYTMYGFKHTYITKIYNSLLENTTPHQAKSELMLITGHATMSALEKYLRDIDAVLPEDYSKHIQKPNNEIS